MMMTNGEDQQQHQEQEHLGTDANDTNNGGHGDDVGNQGTSRAVKVVGGDEDPKGKGVISSSEAEEEEELTSHDASDDVSSSSEKNHKVRFASDDLSIAKSNTKDPNNDDDDINNEKKKKKHSSSPVIYQVKKSTERAYSESLLCCPVRFVRNFPRDWPRVTTISCGMIVPLWVLILIAAAFGTLLADLEHENEIATNDDILAQRALVENLTLSEAKIFEALPTFCLNEYFGDNNLVLDPSIENTTYQNNTDSSFVIPVDDNINYATSLNGTNVTSNQTSAPITGISDEGFFLVDMDDLLLHMENCSRTTVETPILDDAQGLIDNLTAFGSLTFNWNRCWPKEMHDAQLDGWVFYPTQEIIDASRPSAQEDTYTQEWMEMQQLLLEQYLDELPSNATEEDRYDAYVRSVEDATGAETCQLNVGGTAWFFFTVMTTVGT